MCSVCVRERRVGQRERKKKERESENNRGKEMQRTLVGILSGIGLEKKDLIN
jgi:hypothetical protein